MTDILEMRTADGILRAFEVPSTATNFGALCAEIARIPGVRFLNKRRFLWYDRSGARFEYKGHEFEVSIPRDGYWVGPTSKSVEYPELGDVLQHVKSVLPQSLRHKIIARLLPD